MLNNVVDMKLYGFDRCNRILLIIYREGQNINVEMAWAGLVEASHGIAPHRFDIIQLWQAEKEAGHAKKGMWSLGKLIYKS